MNFTDFLFFPAFLCLLIAYYVLPLSLRWILLLAASLVYYASWGAWGFVYLLGAVLVSWFAALWLERARERDASVGRRRAILWLGILLTAGVLVLVKIRSAMPESIIARLMPQTGSVLVPLGISYFTLSLVGYLADVYWKKDTAEKNPLRLLLYAAYLPKIVEGPIARHSTFAKELNEGHRFNYQNLCFGLQRMLWGYCKKLVIANRLALYTDTVFTNYRDYNGGILLVAAIFAAFELYCDFSGCMDMAVGMSEALGIRLDENFRRPFFSQSAAEFWRRWHITLGAWFKDYIYMPLVVSPTLTGAAGKIRKRWNRRAGRIFLTVIPTAVVWILTGLWHGTGKNYIVWGFYWGFLIILSNVFDPEIRKLTAFFHINPKSSGWQTFRKFRTFILFVISRMISVPSSLHATLVIFKRILCAFAPWELLDGTLLQQGLGGPNFVLVVVLMVLLMVIEHDQEQGVVFRERIAAMPIGCRWLIYLGGIFFVLIFGVYGGDYDTSAFVYMNF